MKERRAKGRHTEHPKERNREPVTLSLLSVVFAAGLIEQAPPLLLWARDRRTPAGPNPYREARGQGLRRNFSSTRRRRLRAVDGQDGQCVPDTVSASLVSAHGARQNGKGTAPVDR